VATATLGPFLIDRLLARGGMAEVWRGRHLASGEPVAIKVLSSEGARTEAFRRALLQEVHAVARLDHDRVVRVFDVGEVPPGRPVPAGSPFLAMELVEGATLRHGHDELAWPEVERVLASLLDALAHAHGQEILHCDVKPSNVLIAADGSVKLADFGMATAWLRGAVPPGGTPRYMAPEQIMERVDQLGPATDLYAVGCLTWWAVCGRPPFDSPAAALRQPLPRFAPRFAVPRGLQAWLEHLLAKSARDRYRWAADARAALDDLAQVSRVAPAARPLPVPPDRRLRRRPATTLVGAGLRLFNLRPPPFVARPALQQALWQALDGVTVQRRAAVVVLRGPSGGGKSRLAAWLASRARELGAAIVLRAEHNPIPQPLDGIGGALARHLRVGLPSPEAEGAAREALEELGVADASGQLAELLCGLPSERPRMEQHAAVRELLSHIADPDELRGPCRPVLVWLDDVVWDEASVALAAHLLQTRRGASAPVLLVLTAASELLAERPLAREALDALQGAIELEVPQLPPGRASDLVEGMLGLQPELAARVAVRSAGNPLFAVELVRDWVDRGLLQVGPRGFVLEEGASDSLPTSLTSVWRRRLARVVSTDDDAAALEIAAALGLVVDGDTWRRVCTEAGVTPRPGLRHDLARSGLLVQERDRDRWRFTNALLREVLREQASHAARWASHHACCARVLADLAPDDPERLGRHYLGAGHPQEAAEPLLQGALRAIARGDYGTAEELLRERGRALGAAGVAASAPVRARGDAHLAMVVQLLGRYDEVDELAVAAARHLVGHPEGAVAIRARAEAALVQGRLDEALRWFDEAGAWASEHGDQVLQGYALRGAGSVLARQGKLAESRAMLELALRLREGDGGREFDVLLALGFLAFQQGDLDDVAAWVDRARQAAAQLGSRSGQGVAANLAAERHRHLGHLPAAAAGYRDALEHLEAVGSAQALVVRINLGLLLVDTGDDDEARQQLGACLVASLGAASPFTELTCRLGLVAVGASLDEHLPRIDAALVDYADPDLARLAERGASRANEEGERRILLGHARRMYAALGRDDEVRRLDQAATAS